MSVSPQQMSQMMKVTVPDGVGPGMPFAVNTPSGQTFTTVCPEGVAAGGEVMISVPAPGTAAAVTSSTSSTAAVAPEPAAMAREEEVDEFGNKVEYLPSMPEEEQAALVERVRGAELRHPFNWFA